MIVDFDASQPVIGRKDGSFEVSKGTHRFHVLSPALAEQYGIFPKPGSERDTPNGWKFYREVTELWPEVSAFAKAHPERILTEPDPPKAVIDPDSQVTIEIQAALIEKERQKPEWVARRAELAKGLSK